MIWIVGGTSEGRQIAERLKAEGITFCLSVATELGRETYGDCTPHLIVGRLDSHGFELAFVENAITGVIDASHPHALAVTEAVQVAASNLSLPYIRFERPVSLEGVQAQSLLFENEIFNDFESLWQALRYTTGKVLLTGSKELEAAIKVIPAERLVARVVPSEESMRLCHFAGLTAGQIIGMKGPFSYDMNVITLKTYQIEHFVFKSSGSASGFDEKVRAVRSLNIRPWVVRAVREDHSAHPDAVTVSSCDALVKALNGKGFKGDQR